MKRGRDIIERMKEAAGLRTDSGLATYLGVPGGTVASWRHRDRVPFQHILAFAKKCPGGLGRVVGTSVGYGDAGIDSDLLALAIDQAEAVVRKAHRERPFETAELALLVAQLYDQFGTYYLDLLDAAKVSGPEAIEILRRLHDLPSDRRIFHLGGQVREELAERREKFLRALPEALFELARQRR